MKKLIAVMLLSVGVMFSPFVLAQTAAVPEDTQARTASNLVNQVSAANFKSVAEVPALAQNQVTQASASAYADVLKSSSASFDRRQQIADAALAVSLKSFQTMNAQESMALAKSMQADQANQLQQLLTALNGGGVMTKSMQTVPPVSVPPPAGGQ